MSGFLSRGRTVLGVTGGLRGALIGVIAMAGAANHANAANASAVLSVWTDSQPDDDRGSFRHAMIDLPNQERQRLGIAPLRWDDQLADHAKQWAEELARRNEMEHDPRLENDVIQGENLWMGTRKAFSYRFMVNDWLVERDLYKSGHTFPNVSKTGNYVDVGHYTQLIWKDTRRVGCAIAENPQFEYLVCRYDPAGNWEGVVAEHGGL